MSITLYREGLPRIELGAQFPGREGMLVGFYDHDHGSTSVGAIVMTEDGALSKAGLGDFRLQMHYDAETDEWVDENAEPDQAVEAP